MTASIPVPGQLVEVRRRQFIVSDVSEAAMSPDALRPPIDIPHHLVTRSSVEEEALADEKGPLAAAVRKAKAAKKPAGKDQQTLF